jgi:hypothetical protein
MAALPPREPASGFFVRSPSAFWAQLSGPQRSSPKVHVIIPGIA